MSIITSKKLLSLYCAIIFGRAAAKINDTCFLPSEALSFSVDDGMQTELTKVECEEGSNRDAEGLRSGGTWADGRVVAPGKAA